MAAVEDRRLKGAGLALLALATAVFAWLGNRLAIAPLDARRSLLFATATVIGVNLSVAGLLALIAGCGAPPSWRNRRRRRALLLQILLANLLAPAVMYGLLTSHAPTAEGLEASGWDVPIILAVYLLGVVSWRLWRRAQQYEAIDADEAMARDPRPPVLYLRSFKDDGAAVLAPGEQRIAQRVMSVVEPPSPEQELADILGRLGPVVAIGKPGEVLPELGAARLYVAHDRWQAKVDELMTKAAMVVIRIGDSPGVVWEIDRALARVVRQRIVFAFLNGASVAPLIKERLAPALGSEWEHAMAQPTGGWMSWVWSDPRRRIGSFVYFRRDGAPHAVAVSNWPPWGRDVWLSLMLRPYALPLRRAWREIFSGLGLEAGTMDRKPSRVLAVILAIVAGYAGAHWFYLGRSRRGWTYVALIPAAFVSVPLGLFDAFRFIWVDRATFDARFTSPEGARTTHR